MAEASASTSTSTSATTKKSEPPKIAAAEERYAVSELVRVAAVRFGVAAEAARSAAKVAGLSGQVTITQMQAAVDAYLKTPARAPRG